MQYPVLQIDTRLALAKCVIYDTFLVLGTGVPAFDIDKDKEEFPGYKFN